MAITDIRTPGSRLSMTDSRRWGRARDTDIRVEEKPRIEPEQRDTSRIVETVAETGDNVDLSLRDRIRRLSRKTDRASEERSSRPDTKARGAEVPVTSFQQAPPRDRAAEAERQRPERQAPEASAHSRQSARPRQDLRFTGDEETRLPATRRSSEPEPHAERLVASNDEVDALREEIREMRAEMARMREEMNEMAKSGGGGQNAGVRAVEKAVQRLAERMDNVDGGARVQPQIAEAREPRKIGLRERLFGR